MNLTQIKISLDSGQKVYQHNGLYEVIKDSIGQYLIKSRGNCIGLTHADGITLNGNDSDFYPLLSGDEAEKNVEYYSDYFEAMFWADIDGSEDIDNSDCLGIYDIDRHSLSKQISQLDSFFHQADEILEATDYTHEQTCHDFYFTRQGHGVGFWENDHCEEPEGELLTDLSKKFGEIYSCINGNKVVID